MDYETPTLFVLQHDVLYLLIFFVPLKNYWSGTCLCPVSSSRKYRKKATE